MGVIPWLICTGRIKEDFLIAQQPLREKRWRVEDSFHLTWEKQILTGRDFGGTASL